MRDMTAAADETGLWPVIFEGVCFEAGGQRLVDNLSLTVVPGPLTCVMGPNGAGKSLMIRLLAGLLRPSAGRITYGGAETPAPHRIAIVFQRPVLLRRSVRSNLDHALKLYGVPRGARPARIADLLAEAGLAEMATRPARVLSGGEQQRLALVRALAARPALLLLDEPAASLDPQATAAVEALVVGAVARGIKVVLVTHDRDQARRLASEIVFLHRGRIVERAPAAEFFDRPRSPEARAYLAGELLV